MIRDVIMNNEEIDRELGKVINEWYQWVLNEITRNIAKDQMREYGTELLHFVILELYNKTPEYKLDLINNKKVPFWLLTSSGLQLRSGSSPFYRQIRSNRMSARSGAEDLDFATWEPYDGEMYDCFTQGMEQLDFYHRKLIEEKYLNEMTFKDISNKYQIAQHHIKKDLYIALQLIRDHCKHV
jgi:DNA-directed RNA polymerase specialized sigma24 family protein